MKIKLKKIICVLIIFVSVLLIGWGIFHYGQGVVSYYEDEMETIPQISDVFYLEKDTVVEQRIHNEAPYIIGVDIILIGTGEQNTGTLYVQLCDAQGDVISQKREQIQEIEPGQFYPIRFLQIIDSQAYDDFVLKFFAEDCLETPGILAISETNDFNQNIGCEINGVDKNSNLLLRLVFGRTQYVGYNQQTNGTKEALMAFILLILIISGGLLYALFNYRKIKTLIFKIWNNRHACIGYILGILSFFWLFLAAATLYKVRNNVKIPLWVMIYFILCLALIIYYWKKNKICIKKKLQIIYGNIWKEWKLIALIGGSTVIRLPMFVHAQLWDGGIYYVEIQRACQAFDFSLTSIWNHFRLCAHYSIIYTLFVSIGEFLLPDSVTGVLTITLILTDIAIVCLYKMLRGWWLNLSATQAALSTFLVSICPLFLGLFCNISIDSLLIVFTIYLLYADYKNNNFMKTIWLLAIFQTKETGIVIIGGYLLAHIGKHMVDTFKKNRKERFSYFVKEYSVICSIIGVFFLCIYIVIQGGLFTWLDLSNITEGNLLTRYIQELIKYPDHIIHKLKLLFVLHFQWIPTLIICFCWGWSKFVQNKKIKFNGQLSFYGILGMYLLSNIYLFLYALARYHIVGSVMMWILAIIFIFKTFRSFMEQIWGNILIGIIIVIVFIQNFFCLDPVTNRMFSEFDTGKRKIISTEMNGGNFGDTFTNNFQHTYLIDLIDQMMNESSFDENTEIIVPYERDYNMLYYGTGYDKEKKRRVFKITPDGEHIVAIRQELLADVLMKDIDEMPDRCIMYFLPYLNCDEEGCVQVASTYYNTKGPFIVSNWGGTIKYYILTKK